MKLVIVESPTKAKTIGRFLGKDYEIRASMGHVMDLPKSKLGVDIDHDFAPDLVVSPDKKKTIAELKKLAKEADAVILATDPDREGEAISANIQEVLSEGKGKNKHFSRIVFHEITKEAIEEAIAHPGTVNIDLVNAQTARRVLDRLVGYKLSPILWQKVRRGLSAGRVQSVALRLIVEREREIATFTKEPYWTLTLTLVHEEKKEGVMFALIAIDDSKIEQQKSVDLYDGTYKVTTTTITTEEQAEKIKTELGNGKFVVSEVLKKESKRSPQPPYTTSTLQQDASRRFGYSGKRTMSLAQKLYEEGFITYHRTDSFHLAEAAVMQIREYVTKEFGEKYVPASPRFYATKQKNAQEAHEAIRPTKVKTTVAMVTEALGVQYGKLYEMIWRRTVACQMSDALVESTTVMVDAKRTEHFYKLKANGSVLLFEGFLKVNPFGLTDNKLPLFATGENLLLQDILSEKHETPPPPRYNDASLIKSLEEGGIGRPSTYASIIGTIEARNYIEREQSRFVPTAIGMAVNDFLVKNFSTVDDIPFTASMENELDEIANGTKEWVPVIRQFWDPFNKKLSEVASAARVEIPVEETGEICPKDGAPLVIRTGKFGKFISCKNFPTCDFKKPYVEETNFICPKDGGKIIAKKTRKGRTFYGCSNYPNCDFAVWKLTDLKKEEQKPKE